MATELDTEEQAISTFYINGNGVPTYTEQVGEVIDTLPATNLIHKNGENMMPLSGSVLVAVDKGDLIDWLSGSEPYQHSAETNADSATGNIIILEFSVR